MSKAVGLVKRGSVYQIRVRVPADVVAHLKKREITYSLYTSDRNEAKQRALVERVKIEDRFIAARGKQPPLLAQRTIQDLSAEEVQDLALSWFHGLEASSLLPVRSLTKNGLAKWEKAFGHA